MNRLNLKPASIESSDDLFPEQKVAIFRFVALLEMHGGLDMVMRRTSLLQLYREAENRRVEEFTPERLKNATWVPDAEKASIGKQEKERQLEELRAQLKESGALPEDTE